MSTIKRIIYDCRQATYLIEKRQDTTLTFKEWLRLFIHLLGCSVCRLFQRQSRVISESLKILFRRSEEQTHTLNQNIKQDMQNKINERLTK